MRSTLFLLLFGVLRLAAFAEEYPEFNFAMDLPKGWKVDRPSNDLLFRVTNPEGSVNIVAATGPVTMFERVTATKDARGGMKSAMSERGWVFSKEVEIKIGQIPFIFFTGVNPDGQTCATYCSGAGNTLYLINATAKNGDVLQNPEVRASIDSFRLLKPAPILPLTGMTRAYGFGVFLGQTMAFGMIMKLPNGVIWVIKGIWI